MRIAILAVGRLKSGPETDLVARYLERAMAIGPRLGLTNIACHDIPESRARRPEDRKIEERDALLSRASHGLVITLDERGRNMGSVDFAQRIASWRDEGTEAATFIIGGADGLDAALPARAALNLSFGAMTLPHQLVRVLLAEQIYRAMTILTGHPYHRV
jgi:23S rRNA (pseudouridine1915-N3)-methyltransferase